MTRPYSKPTNTRFTAGRNVTGATKLAPTAGSDAICQLDARFDTLFARQLLHQEVSPLATGRGWQDRSSSSAAHTDSCRQKVSGWAAAVYH
ncbi:hypothetical protein WJX72_000334 [[Myrmecia] bisecta]|uniref:Uncharacterized protein n=1 Tax=[Myrmecia] bisecta TaxID=41462 RepID=A0AAW1P3R5_9CHLO